MEEQKNRRKKTTISFIHLLFLMQDCDAKFPLTSIIEKCKHYFNDFFYRAIMMQHDINFIFNM